MIASSTVRPALEWISVSLAASTSPIRSVNPIRRSRGSSPNSCATRARVLSLRPHRHSTIASGTFSASRVAPTRSPTPQPPPDTAITLRSIGSASARRASSRDRAARNAGEVGGLAQRALPGPAICSTSASDSGWVMKCRSIPGCAQKWSPARSVIDE